MGHIKDSSNKLVTVGDEKFVYGIVVLIQELTRKLKNCFRKPLKDGIQVVDINNTGVIWIQLLKSFFAKEDD